MQGRGFVRAFPFFFFFYFFFFLPDADKKRYRDSRTMRWLARQADLVSTPRGDDCFLDASSPRENVISLRDTGDPRKNPPPCEHVNPLTARIVHNTLSKI